MYEVYEVVRSVGSRTAYRGCTYVYGPPIGIPGTFPRGGIHKRNSLVVIMFVCLVADYQSAIFLRAERIENLATISAGNRELETDIRCPVLYADPPWRYENPPIGASNRSIENHYPTMTLEEICALPAYHPDYDARGGVCSGVIIAGCGSLIGLNSSCP